MASLPLATAQKGFYEKAEKGVERANLANMQAEEAYKLQQLGVPAEEANRLAHASNLNSAEVEEAGAAGAEGEVVTDLEEGNVEGAEKDAENAAHESEEAVGHEAEAEEELSEAEHHGPPATNITTPIPAGATILPVRSNVGFQIGEVIIIDEGELREVNVIAGMGTLVTKYPVMFSHAPGAPVTGVFKEEELGQTPYACLVLLGVVCAVMAMYYLLNSHHEGVPGQTWTMLSNAISIFIAVMSYSGVKQIFMLVAQMHNVRGAHDEGAHLGPHETEPVHEAAHRRLHAVVEPTMGHLFISISVMLFWYIVVMTVIAIQSSNRLRLQAWGLVGGHILGFAAIDLFGGTIAMFPFFNTREHHLLVILMYIVIMPIPGLLFRCFAGAAMSTIEADDEVAENVHEQCTETAIDSFAMGLSFIIGQWFRGLIVWPRTGHMAGFRANSKYHPDYETAILDAIGIAFLFLAGGLRLCHHKYSRQKSVFMHNFTEVLFSTAALTAAWCGLHASYWMWLHAYKDHLFMAKLCIAMYWSIGFIIVVYLFACFTENISNRFHRGSYRRVLKGEMTAIGIAVGLSWEVLFHRALEDVGEYMAEGPSRHVWTSLFSLLLVVIVAPAWVVYVVSKHDKHFKKEYSKKRLAPWQACCDCPCDDYSDKEGDDTDTYEEYDEETEASEAESDQDEERAKRKRTSTAISAKPYKQKVDYSEDD